MACCDPESLSGEADCVRVFLASKLETAQKVESFLDEHKVDYAVRVEPYRDGVLSFFFGEYMGAMFYVEEARAAEVRHLLRNGGFRKGVLKEG